MSTSSRSRLKKTITIHLLVSSAVCVMSWGGDISPADTNVAVFSALSILTLRPD